MSIKKRPAKKAKTGYTYMVYFPYVDATGVRRKFSKSGFATKKEALDYEAAKRKELKDFGDIQGVCEDTFNEVFEEYMKLEGSKYSLSTKTYYETTYENYIKKSIGKRKIVTLRYKDLQGFLNNTKCSYDTAKNIRKVFAVTFKYAYFNEMINFNPMSRVRIMIQQPPKKKDEPQTIDREQLNKVIECLLTNSKHAPDPDFTRFNSYAFAVAVFIGWFTGLRISETMGLEKKDFDFEKGIISIQRRLEYQRLNKDQLYVTEKLKTDASKAEIPMAEELMEGMKKWFEKNPYERVICDINGNYIHPFTFQSRLREVNLETGFYFHYHMLRHSFTSNLISSGVSPIVTKELVRHSDINTTLGVYTHVLANEKEEALKKTFG
ncbi:MAG: site-specific integrase [Erysipelotrichaceae bacterium]|nr:site-specific integrase [Erysipelotrichaceae bacterium]